MIDAELVFAVEFAVVFDANGFRLERVGGRSPVRLEGVSVAKVEQSFGEFVQLAADNVALHLDAFTTDSQGQVRTNGPFLTFGGTRPEGEVTDEDDLDVVDGSISVMVGYEGMGIGGKAGNFGIGWDPINTNPDDDESFSMGLRFYQLPGFFAALIKPEAEDGGADFSFGLEWIGVNITEIGLRFRDPLDLTEITDPILELLPNGGNDSRDDGGGAFEAATSFGLNQLRNVNLMFSGGVETGPSLFGDLLSVRGIVDDAEIDIRAVVDCAVHVWEQRDSLGIAELVEDADGNETPGRVLAAIPGLVDELFRSGDAPCTLPIKGIDAFDVGLGGVEIGPLELGGGLGFGQIDFDKDGDGTEDSKVSFFRGQLEAAVNGYGAGFEIIITEYGPVVGRILAGGPIPIGALIGAIGGSAVAPGPGTAIGGAGGAASGFLLTGTEGGIIFDGEPLPVVTEPTDLLRLDGFQMPSNTSLADIRTATERLFRDANGNPLEQPRTPWDNGFSLVVSGTLTNQYVLTALGLDITLGVNVGYDLPDYKLASTGEPVIDALRDGNILPEQLSGTFDALGDISAGDVAEWVADGASESDWFELLAGGLKVPHDIEPIDFTNAFPFGLQLYGLGELEVFGFGVAEVGALLDYSDPLNPVIDIAGQLPADGSVLELVLPAAGEVSLRYDSDGLNLGGIIAAQTLFQQIFNGTVEVGQTYFEDLVARVVAGVNEDIAETRRIANYSGRTLTQFVLNRLAPTDDISVDEFRDWLMGDVLNFDFEGGELPDLALTRVQEAMQIGAALMSEFFDAANSVPDAPVDFDSDPWLQRLLDMVVPGYDQLLENNNPFPESDPAFTRYQQAIPEPPTYEPTLQDDPLVFLAANRYREFVSARDLAVGGMRTQFAVMQAIGSVLWSTVESAPGVVETFFETINPSLTIEGAIEPVLLGMPVGEPIVSASVQIDKRGVHLDARGLPVMKTLASLAAGLGGVIPLYDEIDLSLSMPFENLYRDLFVTPGQFPQIDSERDWRGTFQGTAAFGAGPGAGINMGDITGLIFPAVEADFDPSKPFEGLVRESSVADPRPHHRRPVNRRHWRTCLRS